MKKRFVIKIGSSLLTDVKGYLNKRYLNKLVRSLARGLDGRDERVDERVDAGRGYDRGDAAELIVVTSGAIATGIGKLNLTFSPKSLPEKQALAAIGQVGLMNEYERLFNKYNKIVAQVLLTREDIQKRERYLNIRNTILNLIKRGIIPIINENDTVSTEEIRFGDNDTLAALVAVKSDANYLIMLTDVDGLFTFNPKKSKEAYLIKEVKSFKEISNVYIGKRGTTRGVGGMETKINAAKIACSSGVTVIIANGNKKYVLDNMFRKEDLGTTFLPDKKTISQRKKWLTFGAKIEGNVFVDDGAKQAVIEKNRSLLPAGIIKVTGTFVPGDVITIKDREGNSFAQGITSYSASDIDKIKGCKTKDIENILGYKYYDEIVHKDNLVVL